MPKTTICREMEHKFRELEKLSPRLIGPEQSEGSFSKIYGVNPSAMVITTLAEGKCIEINDSFTRITGYSHDEAVGRTSIEMGFWIKPEDRARVIQALKKSGSYRDLEFNFRNKSGDVRLGSFSSKVLEINGDECIITAIQDITERRQAENALRFFNELLKTVNEHFQIVPMLDEFVKKIKEYTCCDAVGVRLLDEEGNIPYGAYQGFSRSFYETESPLSIESDHCMCINVIKGTTDPELPFYTGGGSFYMNGTTRFLATVSPDEKGETRNMCNKFGYESVALIPLCIGGHILGLIHVADHKENMVPLEKVEQLQWVAKQLANGIERVRKDEMVRSNAELFRKTFEAIPDPAFLWQMQFDGRIILTNLNKAAAGFAGWDMADVKGLELEAYWGEQTDIVSRIKHALETRNDWKEEIEYLSCKSGQVYWLDICLASPFKNGVLVIAKDITERKQSEKELKRIEWLLTSKPVTEREEDKQTTCGDLTDLNNDRTIMDLVGKDVLKGIMESELSMLDTSAAIFEKNGDYALRVMNSGWCRLLTRVSRKLSGGDDNKRALNSGNWHCHESCWHEASKISIDTGKPVDVECRGGIRIYASPIRAGGKIIGAISLGYGDPPNSSEKLQEIARRYHVALDLLKEQADKYESRPTFIIDIARKRLSTSADLIGTIVFQKRMKDRVAKSLKQKETLLQEIHHRVKNNMQVISNLLKLQAKGEIDWKSMKVLNDSRSRIHAMSLVHETLCHTDNLSAIEVRTYLFRLVNTISQAYAGNAGGIELKITADELHLGIDQAIPLGLVINELISNAFKHAYTGPGEGIITVRVTEKASGVIELVVGDNGVGIPKNIDWRNTETLGFQLVTGLVEHQLDGTVDLDRTRGTRFTIAFPLNGKP